MISNNWRFKIFTDINNTFKDKRFSIYTILTVFPYHIHPNFFK